MKVFISWSGERSLAVAEILKDWIRKVIQAVKPWMSASDIDKGTRWNPELSQQLEATRFGLICLTPENQTAPWILFEAGALSKTLEHTYVSPVLFSLTPTDVKPPLSQFQLTKLEKEDMLKLMQTINRALAQLSPEQSLTEKELSEAFSLRWPQLEENLKKIPPVPAFTTEKRSLEDMIEETLELVRRLARPRRTIGLGFDIGDWDSAEVEKEIFDKYGVAKFR